MEDSRIVALYWARDEEAIRATASNMAATAALLPITFFAAGRTRRKSSTIHTWARGMLCRRIARRF